MKGFHHENKRKSKVIPVGTKFGNLTIISEEIVKCMDSDINRNYHFYKCRCICGNEKEINKYVLLRGRAVSCGCKKLTDIADRTRKHGMWNTKLYGVWAGIKNRCDNKNSKNFKNYGGRGISICKEWYDFSNFYYWAQKNGYKEGLTIDRINVNGNYCPENCRWITNFEQSRNKTTNVFITYKGKTMILKDWASHTGIYYGKISRQLKNGVPLEEIFEGVVV